MSRLTSADDAVGGECREVDGTGRPASIGHSALVAERDEMFDLMSSISQRAYAASWMGQTQYDVWRW